MEEDCADKNCLMKADRHCQLCEDAFCDVCLSEHMEEFHNRG